MTQLADFGGFLYNLTIKARYANSHPNIVRIANTCQWIRGHVIAKSAGSGEPVFTSMDTLLYGL
jgi:hypothetical protein